MSISMGGDCVMMFSDTMSEVTVGVTLKGGDLLVMNGEARYRWRHGIRPRKTDWIDVVRSVRERRLSLTFRKMEK